MRMTSLLQAERHRRTLFKAIQGSSFQPPLVISSYHQNFFEMQILISLVLALCISTTFTSACASLFVTKRQDLNCTPMYKGNLVMTNIVNDASNQHT